MKPNQQTEDVKTDPTEFSSTIIRIAVSQICRSVGFKAIQFSALELLTDLATRHLRSIGRSAVSSANASNRTQPNVFDLVNAFNDLNSVMGFQGACNLHKDYDPLLSSGAFADLVRFVQCSHEIPFARPISHLSSSDSSVPVVPCNIIQRESGSCPGHIPRWLPDLPDSSTFERSHEDLEDRLKRRKYELWGDAVSPEANDDFSTMDAGERRVQTKNGKQMGKLKFKIARVKNGLNGTRWKELASNVAIDDNTGCTSDSQENGSPLFGLMSENGNWKREFGIIYRHL
ncbi:transcription initiation factor TFIID subunit 8-like isoform X1 [Punica granatum]|uniref:Transcription initiation factor TFIID subunit 8-like isoform X1 n=1 Tax=Punica granatum TaxID=22663 RepID=A0A6P8EBJ1_PUNGR|nr:transcription initiation factor TFIID subunit 8-like isoform X1 [Punica granatum]